MVSFSMMRQQMLHFAPHTASAKRQLSPPVLRPLSWSVWPSLGSFAAMLGFLKKQVSTVIQTQCLGFLHLVSVPGQERC